MSTDLQQRMDRMGLSNGSAQQQQQQHDNNGLSVPQMRKQRSQRFTIPTSPPSTSPRKSRVLPPPIPSLPYQPAPPPVQSQSITTDPYYPFSSGPLPTSSSFSSADLYSTTTNTNAFNSLPPPHQPQPYQPYLPTPIPQTYTHHSQPQPHLSNGFGGAFGAFLPTQQQQQAPIARGTPTRSALPSDWTGAGGARVGNHGGGGGQQQQTNYQSGYAALVGRPGPEDEVIPTAIVIKNIPFQVPKEALLGVMEELRLPPPFAFNYHFDNGQFRGLAFANFRAPSDAALTVSALNGFDLQGRKLRCEYKKVLKEGEKERIERDKAMKRMRSIQGLSQQSYGNNNNNNNNGDGLGPPTTGWNRREASAPGGYPGAGGGGGGGEEDDYGSMVQGQFSTFGGGGGGGRSFGQREFTPAPPLPTFVGVGGGEDYGSSPPSDVGTSISTRMTRESSETNSGGVSEGSTRGGELDLNDPQALEIYSRVLIFKDDSLRDELAFARSLSTTQRRTVHLVAKKLGLEHRSVGNGEDRHVVVYKDGISAGRIDRSEHSSSPARSLRHSASTTTFSRAPPRDITSSYLSPSTSDQNLSLSSPSQPISYLQTSPAGLRGKKSMPDLVARRSRSNLREGFATIATRTAGDRRSMLPNFFADSAPPPPTSTTTTSNGGGGGQTFYSSSESSPSLSVETSGTSDVELGGGGGQGFAVRQPKGPEAETNRGFSDWISSRGVSPVSRSGF